MTQSSERYVVTGAAGFIGENLVARLLADGCDVIGLDKRAPAERPGAAHARLGDRFRSAQVDCADIAAYRAVLNDLVGDRPVAGFWHLAANSDIRAGTEDPTVDLRDTFLTTFNSLQLMREFGAAKMYFASSSAIYGDFGEQAIREDSGPCRPASNYGAMKLASEAQISAAFESFLDEAYLFRFPNVVGSPATHGVILDFIHKLQADPTRLQVLGDGQQTKSYLHVADLVDAMLFVARRGADEVNIFNIGPEDTGVTVRFIAEQVRDLVSPGARIHYGQDKRGWVGDVPKFHYDVGKLKALGWAPSVGSREAVVKAIAEIWTEVQVR